MPDDATAARQALLRRLAALQPQMRARAGADDAGRRFPRADLEAWRGAGGFTATLPPSLGGLGFGAGRQGALDLARLLAGLGEASLPLLRLHEAHVNALQLILRYGTPAQAAAAAADAAGGHLFALWVTDPLDRPPARLAADGCIEGEKQFCSGAGFATRALITLETPEGSRMAVIAVPRHGRGLDNGPKLSGMRAAVTGGMDLTGLALGPDDLLGQPGDYLREPVFSAGAWRGSAGALGGLRAVLGLVREALRHRRRDRDPHQRARFGRMLVACETARLWVDQAALRACLEEGPPEEIVAYVNLARIAVETACLDALRDAQRSLGLAAFLEGSAVERIGRDLATYLRQPAPDETLDKAAAHHLAAGRLPA